MQFDYSALEGRIKEKFGNQYAFAYAMGLSERTISLKLNNKVGWRDREMEMACKLLDIDLSEIPKYFFAVLVQTNWTFLKKNKRHFN